MTLTNLHQIEKKILQTLKENSKDLNELATSTNLSLDNVRRGIEWLKFKGLVLVSVQKKSIIQDRSKELSKSIKELQDSLKALSLLRKKDTQDRSKELSTSIKELQDQLSATRILPERKIIKKINSIRKEKIAINDLVQLCSIPTSEFSVGLQKAITNDWLVKERNNLKITQSSDKRSPEEILLNKIRESERINRSELSKKEIQDFDLLKKRPGYVKEIIEKSFTVSLTEEGKKVASKIISDFEEGTGIITSEILNSGKWKNMTFRGIDVSSPVRNYNVGRIHPLTDLINEIREIFISMGFSEIDGSTIQSCFWNFDVLFTPQDHPAREIQDTFYLSSLTDEEVDINIINKVSEFHKKEWNYDWDLHKSKKMVLRTHTTPVTIKYLSQNKLDSGRIFSIGRVFRNEKMSYKHLMEFHQVEGIVTGESVNLRDLMGLQKQFYSKLGIDKVKFWPTYFPYTEPSLQSMVYIDKLQKWVELFGMGMFRPEVTQSIGIVNNVLAWGGGLERIAMIRYGLNDVRELYDNKLSWLRMQPICPL